MVCSCKEQRAWTQTESSDARTCVWRSANVDLRTWTRVESTDVGTCAWCLLV